MFGLKKKKKNPVTEATKKSESADHMARTSIALQFMFHASARAKKNKIVVLSPGGFSDNSKYIFLHMHEHLERYDSNLELYWVSHSEDEAVAVREMGGKAIAYSSNNPESLRVLLEAKVCLRSTHHLARPDYCYLQAAVSGAINIQMWHGIPAKKVAYQLLRNRKDPAGFSFFANDCLASDYVLAESEFVSPRYAEAFPNATILVNGSPRTDCLIGEAPTSPFFYLNTDAEIINAMASFRASGGKTALYAPTFREGGQDRGNFFREVKSFLSEAAKDPDLMVVLKNHKVSKDDDALREIVLSCQSPRILMPKQSDDIYPYLREASVLVTDYSSTLYDYLLTGRDLVFFQPDLEEYTQKREIYDEENLSSMTLGQKAFDGVAVLAAVKAEQSIDIKQNREALKQKLFAHVDGQSSERLSKSIFGKIFTS